MVISSLILEFSWAVITASPSKVTLSSLKCVVHLPSVYTSHYQQGSVQLRPWKCWENTGPLKRLFIVFKGRERYITFVETHHSLLMFLLLSFICSCSPSHIRYHQNGSMRWKDLLISLSVWDNAPTDHMQEARRLFSSPEVTDPAEIEVCWYCRSLLIPSCNTQFVHCWLVVAQMGCS